MINKWEIYFCDLDPAEVRPVIVISNDAVNHNLPVSTVIPLSDVKKSDKIYPTEIYLPGAVTGLQADAAAIIQQIRTVPHGRLAGKAGVLADEQYREQVLHALKLYFEF